MTFPSLHQPLLKIDVSKRRWISQLKAPSFDRDNITGFVFSQDYPDCVFSYKTICQQDKNKTWQWTTGKDFEALRRELRLPFQSFTGQEIAAGRANTETCKVLLTYRNGRQDSSKAHGIKVGVPEVDKLEAMDAIAKILAPELQPFEGYEPISSRHTLDDTAARKINIFTLLGATLETLETKYCSNFTPNYLDQLSDRQLESLLIQNFNIGLKDINQGRKSLESEKGNKLLDQTNELKALIQANQAAMLRLYPNEQLLLVVFYGEQLQTEVKLLQAIIRVLWGEAVELLANRLPSNTHGPRSSLPGTQLKAKERSQKRIEEWNKSITQQIKARDKRTFCLVMARKFYPDPSDQNKFKPDDSVNKPSTRQALAAIAGSCVQFILPIDTTQKKLLKLDNFFHRSQSALKDLLSAHSGRVEDVQEKVNKYLKDIPPEARPKEIIGITIVRKQKGRVRGFIENTFLPVAMRLNVDTGKCEMCFAYENEKVDKLIISPWSNFPDAITSLSQISPVKLADKQETRKTRFMDFVKEIISHSVDEGAQPLVMIDSSNCVQLWPWLADVRMNANQINLGQQYEYMEKVWQGARLVRIRQELAPGIVDKKVRQLVKSSLEDTKSKKELKKLSPDLEFPSASSPTGLFRIGATNKTGCVTYLSVGNKRLHDHARGQSCYQRTKINTVAKKVDGSKDKVFNKAGLALHQIATKLPFVDQWPTPNPIELVVTLRQPSDNPDQLAALVESLRYSFGHYSDWVSLPAPLFFERVVRDYISEFATGDEGTESELET